MTRTNILLLLGVVALIILPLWITHIPAEGEIFTGADGQAENVIMATHAEYEPWFHPFWEPPSGEIESLLFGLQAALGSGLIFYYLGVQRGKKTSRMNLEKPV